MSRCPDVISNFFQTFYEERIELVYKTPERMKQGYDLAILKFWSSVIDFYGGIYFVGKSGNIQRDRRGNMTLATGNSFALFIKAFFPDPEKNYGRFIYSAFRSGAVHQLSPKRSEIHVKHATRSELIWVEIDTSKTDPNDNKVAHMNLELFQELTYQSYNKFCQLIRKGADPTMCENIAKNLIDTPDIFGDGHALNKAYEDLKNEGFDIKKP